MSRLRVLLGGGRGFIGTHLSRLLTKHGYDVTIISRSGGPVQTSEAIHPVITWQEIYDNGIPNNVHAVVNLSGQNIMDMSKRWDSNFEKSLIDSRVHPNQSLVKAIAAAENPPSVFVSASAIGIYPPSETTDYDESYSGVPNDFLTKFVAEWEASAQLPPDSKTRLAIVRIGLALGRDGGVVKNMILPFFLGVGGPLGSGNQWFPWVHSDDVAGIIHHAIAHDHVSGILNAVAPEAATNKQFSKAFASALNRPAAIPMPEFVLRRVLSQQRADMLLLGQRVSPARTLQQGYSFTYPDLASAVKECAHLIGHGDYLKFK